MTKARRRVRRFGRFAAGALWLTAALGPSVLVAQLPDARVLYTRGLTALHLFEYEDANEAFVQAQRADPDFAMAYWGEAMTYNQTLWRREDIPAARQALARLAPSPDARAAKARTTTEKGMMTAVDLLFGAGDAVTRHRQYADAMARVHTADPANADVAALYALALLGTMSRSLIGHDDVHEGRTQGLAGSEIQARVSAILGAVLKTNPEHPGALHYLIHNNDDPAHARQALDAARTLTRVAPDSSHARHMPSHIFFQLGMWRDAETADRSAFTASQAWVTRKNLGPAVRNYHALSWLEYALLQRGRYREAWNTLGELEPVAKSTGQVPLISNLASMKARFVVETRRWQLLARETNFTNVNDLFALGMSAARTNQLNTADRVRQTLAARATSEQEGDLRPAIAIMEREVAGLIELAAGRRERAIEILQAATAAELKLPPPLGLPEPLKPAPELLGEVLVEVGRAREAIEPFQQALGRHPNRSLSVLGLARAYTASGQTEAARTRFRALLANFDEADADVEAVAEARRAIGTGIRD
jgi:tetratricopeptide (TPR) repeat protein